MLVTGFSRLRALLLFLAIAGGMLPLSARPARATASAPQVAFTRHFNVYLTTPAGGDARTVTTRGTGYQGIWYPWYAWSPDGKYLLLLRWQGSAPRGTLLLLDARGTVIRTLATPPIPTDFWPSWALDADQIAFVARQQVDRSSGGFRNTVVRMDLGGRTHPLFTYLSHEGCGGGTSDPAARLYWQETGFGGDALRMSWSVRQSLAAYTASCAGGVNITDLRTDRTQVHSHWIEPALSPRGTLAAAGIGLAEAPPPGLAVILANPRSGRIIRTVAVGELPAWSANGATLYFVQRTRTRNLSARDAGGSPLTLPVFRTSIERTSADGTQGVSLFSTDAYAFGPLDLLNGGQTLIFSRVENDWNLWRHRSKSGILPISPGFTSPYFPQVAIIRWDRGSVGIIEANAGQPVAQP